MSSFIQQLAMVLQMGIAVRKKLKIFRAIVRSLLVDVVNHLVSRKKSPNDLFHNKPMFVNVPSVACVRVIWSVAFHVATSMFRDYILDER